MNLGRFQLVEPIAVGGMSEVFLAKPLASQGTDLVAVKRLNATLCRDPDMVNAFRDEARVLARLDHPHIARFIEYGCVEGTYYIAMEYVRGVDLGKVISALRRVNRAPSLAVVAAVANDLLSALHTAHEVRDPAGGSLALIHRDISPQNLVLGEDGVCKLTDFGIAKNTLQIHRTRPGILKGKMAYVAPEQLFEGATVDRRCDIWAAGIVLYELLTLHHPVRGLSDAETFQRIRGQPISSVRAFRADAPQALDFAIQKALVRFPNNRYDTAEAFRQAVMAAVPPADGRAALKALIAKLFPDGIQRPQTLPIEIPIDETSAPATVAQKRPSRRVSSAAVSEAHVASNPAPKRPGRRSLVFAALAGVLAAGFALGAVGVYRHLFSGEGPARARRADDRPPDRGPRLEVGEPQWDGTTDAVLYVEGRSGDVVLVDGQPMGSPGAFALKPGVHEVALKSDGATLPIRVNLKAGEVQRLQLPASKRRHDSGAR